MHLYGSMMCAYIHNRGVTEYTIKQGIGLETLF